jgi:hypothetical protein
MKALALVGVAFTLLLPIAIAVAEPAAKDPAHSQTAGVLVQAHDIPQPVQTVITNGSMGKKYEVSLYLSPFYLRGDFDGDHKIDIAVLVKAALERQARDYDRSGRDQQSNNSGRRDCHR